MRVFFAIGLVASVPLGCRAVPPDEVASSEQNATPAFDDAFDGTFRIFVVALTGGAQTPASTKFPELQARFDALPGSTHHVSKSFSEAPSEAAVTTMTEWICDQATEHQLRQQPGLYDAVHVSFLAEGDAACVAHLAVRQLRSGACTKKNACVSDTPTDNDSVGEATAADSDKTPRFSVRVNAAAFYEPHCPASLGLRSRELKLSTGLPALFRSVEGGTNLKIVSDKIQTEAYSSSDGEDDFEELWRFLVNDAGYPVADPESPEARFFRSANSFSSDATGTVFQRRRLTLGLTYEEIGAMAGMKSDDGKDSGILAWVRRNKRGRLVDAREGIPLLLKPGREKVAEALWNIEPLPIPLGWLSTAQDKAAQAEAAGGSTKNKKDKFTTFRRQDLQRVRRFFSPTPEVAYPNTSKIPDDRGNNPEGLTTLFRFSGLLYEGVEKMSKSVREEHKLTDDPCEDAESLPGRLALWPHVVRSAGELWSMMAHLIVYANAPIPASNEALQGQRTAEAYAVLNDILRNILPQSGSGEMTPPLFTVDKYFREHFMKEISIRIDGETREISVWDDSYVKEFLGVGPRETRLHADYLKMHPDRFAAELQKWTGSKNQTLQPADTSLVRKRVSFPELGCGGVKPLAR